MPVQSPWNAFSAFQVFGDHVPMDGFSLVVRIAADAQKVEQMVTARAADQDNLDPELGLMMIRAGIGLIRSPSVSFVYVNTEETVVLLRREFVQEVGQSLVVHDHLISSWSARMALISGDWLPVSGQVYEFPDLGVVRKAFRTIIDRHEEHTPERSARRLGVQLRSRGQPFHESMIETLEEQTHLLDENGVDMNALPGWWWRGIAVRSVDPNALHQIQLWSEMPPTDELVELIGAV